MPDPVAKAAIGWAVVPGDDQHPRASELVVRVTEAETGRGIADARVILAGVTRSVVTDSSGTATMRDIPKGTYLLRVSRIGYVLVRDSIPISQSITYASVVLPRDVRVIEDYICTCGPCEPSSQR